MLEEKKNSILTNVKNGSYDFSLEDEYILKNDNKLLIEVLEICLKYPNFNRFDLFSYLDTYEPYQLEEIFSKNVIYKYIINGIRENHIYSYTTISNYFDLSKFSKDEVDQIKKECNKCLSDSSFLCTSTDALELLNSKNYEAISRISELEDDGIGKYNELIERLKKEYPFDKYNLKFINNVFDFSDKLDNINIIYSIIACSNLNNDIDGLMDKIINRLENSEQILMDSKLISKISFANLYYDYDSDVYDKFIKLLYKSNPFLFLKNTFEQNENLSSYYTYIKEQLLESIKEDSILPDIDSTYNYRDKDIFNKLIETKHYKEALLFSYRLEHFDLLSNYINKKICNVLKINDFINIFNKIKNKNLFIKLMKEDTISIEFKDNVPSNIIDFLVKNDINRTLFKSILYDHNILKYLIENYKDYFTNVFLNNIEFGTEIVNSNYEIIKNNKDILDVILSYDKYYLDQFINLLIIDNNLSFQEMFDNIGIYINKYYNIDLKKLNTLKDRFGFQIIKYLNEPKILEILKLNDEDFLKFLNLFSKDMFTMKDLENAFDSILQIKFSIDNINDITIFHDILVSIEINDDKYISLLDKLNSVFDKNTITYFSKKYNIKIENSSDFLLSIINNIKNNNNRRENIDLLHSICSFYLDKLRGEYKNSFNIGDELNLPFSYEAKQLTTALIKEILKNNDSMHRMEIINEILDINNLDSTVGFNVTYDMLEQASLYYSGLIFKNELTINVNMIQKLIPLIVKYSEKKLNSLSKYDYNYYLENAIESNHNIKKIYSIDNPIDLFQILLTLDVEKIKKDLLDNPINYNSFKEVISKLKLNNLPKSLFDYIGNIKGLDISYTTISTFFNYFTSIMNDFNNQNKYLNIATIIKLASVYDSNSLIYKLILGNDDYKLIKRNDGPNEAHQKLEKDQRLIEAKELMIKSFDRKFVTIPTFNEIFNIENGKKIRCVVGNYTNPINLTLGERTGACMRIGGVADSLYYFCLMNENGFHIRFENPETNEFISRVSGFRNGNTVFLNELRYSKDPKYEDEDLIEFLKIISHKIIEDSKNSSYPINNVVIHNDYVTRNMETTNLEVSNIKEGLPYFYSDVNSEAVIIASSNKDGFVPLDLNPNQVDRYEVARDLPKNIINEEDFIKMSARINAIKQTREFGSSDFIDEFNLPNGFVFGVVGDDFYIYLDNDLNIIIENLDIDKRSYLEIETAKKYLEAYKVSIKGSNKL